MSILDRYIASEFWKAFFGALSICVILFMGSLSARTAYQAEIPSQYVFQYNLYKLPEIIVMLLPAACLIATLITLAGMGRRNELTAIFAAGISLARIAFVVLSLVFILCCISFIMTDRVLPFFAKKQAHFVRTEIEKKPEFHSEIKQSKIWYRSKNLIYNLRTFDGAKNRIQGLSIYFFDDGFSLLKQIEAKSAHFENDNWILSDGTQTTFSAAPAFPVPIKFQTQTIQLPEKPEDFKEIEKEVEQLRLKHLWRYIHRNKEAGIDTHSHEVLFWSKINMSLVPLIMALLAIPFSVQNQRHSSLARDLSICFLFIIIYWLIYSTALSLGKSGALPPIIATWLPNLIFFSLGVFLVKRGKKI